MTENLTPPAPGHNRPPLVEFYREQNELLPGYIDAEEVKLFERFNALQEAVMRVPAVCDSDELDAKLTDFVNKQLGECKGALKDSHEKYKRPFLDGGKTVDGIFKRRVDRIEEWQKNIRQTQTDWKLAEEARKRKLAQDEARRQAEEQERLCKEAEALAAAATTDAGLDAAIATEEASRQAEAKRIAAENEATAKAADLTRSRGDHGGVSSLRSEWKGQIEDRASLDLEALRPFLTTDALDQAVRAWTKANAPKDDHSPPPALKGAKIWLHRFTR